MTTGGAFAVFEILNHDRKEILVGITTLTIPEFDRRRNTDLPIDAAHWGPTDELSFRRLAENMPLDDARQFVDLYAFCIERGEWRIIRQAPRASDGP